MINIIKGLIKKVTPNYFLNIFRSIFLPNRLVVMIPTFNYDGLATLHEVEFMEDDRFKKALSKGLQYTENRDDYYRLYIGSSLAEHSAKLDGDFVECGVWLGTMSKTIITYINFNNLEKKFFLFDTFEGIPTKNLAEKDGRDKIIYGSEGTLQVKSKNDTNDKFPDILSLVKSKFQEDNVHIVQGIIPDTLIETSFDKICFLHVDLNTAKPEVEAIKFFWDKIVTSGIILLDDYAYSKQYHLQKQAIDKIGCTLNFSVITLPTGQGLIIKP